MKVSLLMHFRTIFKRDIVLFKINMICSLIKGRYDWDLRHTHINFTQTIYAHLLCVTKFYKIFTYILIHVFVKKMLMYKNFLVIKTRFRMTVLNK